MSIEYTAGGELRLEVRDGCSWLGPVRYADEARRAAVVDGETCLPVPSGEEGYIAPEPEPEPVTDEVIERVRQAIAEHMGVLLVLRLRRGL